MLIALRCTIIETVPATAESAFQQILLEGIRVTAGELTHRHTHSLSLPLLHTKTVLVRECPPMKPTLGYSGFVTWSRQMRRCYLVQWTEHLLLINIQKELLLGELFSAISEFPQLQVLTCVYSIDLWPDCYDHHCLWTVEKNVLILREKRQLTLKSVN